MFGNKKLGNYELSQMENQRKYLDPVNLASVKNLEMRAKLVVEGFITGLHKSPYHGFSVEFSEHRPYRQGDEIRHIDWQSYARTNNYYVKQFEEETNLRCNLIVDSSASMKYASKGHISKFEYSIYLASALAYLMNKQRDAVGLAVFNEKVEKYMPARSKQSYIYQLIKILADTVPSEKTGMAGALNQIAERIKRRGMVIIFSDLFDDLESIDNALKHFRHKSHEVILFHVLDPREIDFNLGSGSTFVDMETSEEILTQPHQLKSAYKEEVSNFISNIKEICYRQKVDYHLVQTNEPFDRSLLNYMSKRRMV